MGPASSLPWLSVQASCRIFRLGRISRSGIRARERTTRFFVFKNESNIYIFPADKTLGTTGHAGSDHTIRYIVSVLNCRACSLKPRCCPNMPSRRILRDINEDARDLARRKMKTKAFLKSRDERKRVEMRFAHLKTHHGFERMRLRGLSGARDEFHLAAIVQNLKTLALLILGPPAVSPAASFA